MGKEESYNWEEIYRGFRDDGNFIFIYLSDGYMGICFRVLIKPHTYITCVYMYTHKGFIFYNKTLEKY
jgi:hypothetical protein